jgi:hypothetical protein
MASHDDLEDVPDWARGLLMQAEHNEIARNFNEALQVIAISGHSGSPAFLRPSIRRSLSSARFKIDTGLQSQLPRYDRLQWRPPTRSLSASGP